MRVLSLFDGISCGMVALERSGITVDKYYASEIEEKAIEISKKNYPEIVQLGDITKLTEEQLKGLGEIDLLIGGSPCQDLSSCKQGEGLNGVKSGLFYEYLRVRDIVKPKYFLLENVIPRSNDDKQIITELMGVEPIYINSADFSAQTRQRLYWTNINVSENRGGNQQVVNDILEDDAKWTDEHPCWADNKWGDKTRFDMFKTPYDKAHCLTASMHKGQVCTYIRREDGKVHKLTPTECERLQTLPEGYTEGVANTHRYKAIGNGWTVNVISHIFKNLKEYEND